MLGSTMRALCSVAWVTSAYAEHQSESGAGAFPAVTLRKSSWLELHPVFRLRVGSIAAPAFRLFRDPRTFPYTDIGVGVLLSPSGKRSAGPQVESGDGVYGLKHEPCRTRFTTGYPVSVPLSEGQTPTLDILPGTGSLKRGQR